MGIPQHKPLDRSDDWLEGPAIVQRKSDVVKEKEFAELYVSAFVKNPAGALLLKHWDTTYRKTRVPTNAPHTQYAAVEAVRSFIDQIYGQIELAGTP